MADVKSFGLCSLAPLGRRASGACALLATGALLAAMSASPAPALAEACAGVGAEPCPYASASIVGQRAMEPQVDELSWLT